MDVVDVVPETPRNDTSATAWPSWKRRRWLLRCWIDKQSRRARYAGSEALHFLKLLSGDRWH